MLGTNQLESRNNGGCGLSLMALMGPLYLYSTRLIVALLTFVRYCTRIKRPLHSNNTHKSLAWGKIRNINFEGLTG